MPRIRHAQLSDVKDAVKIAVMEYREEQQQCSQLPDKDFGDVLQELITSLFQNKYAMVAFEGEQMVGYLAFFGPIEGFHGNAAGIFSPLGGSAFQGFNRDKLASRLLSAVCELATSDGVTSYALSRYAHDKECGKSFVLNGFGIRCCDAVLKLNERNALPLFSAAAKLQQMDNSVSIRELLGEEKKRIHPLRYQLVEHLSHAPTLFPTNIAMFDSWFENENIRIFASFIEEQIVGYMALDDEAETFVTEIEDISNICGAYVLPEYRGSGLADRLLDYICGICRKEGKAYLGVDCETLNPTALHFWKKYFTPYTYSYARRADERIVGYCDYLNDYMENQ